MTRLGMDSPFGRYTLSSKQNVSCWTPNIKMLSTICSPPEGWLRADQTSWRRRSIWARWAVFPNYGRVGARTKTGWGDGDHSTHSGKLYSVRDARYAEAWTEAWTEAWAEAWTEAWREDFISLGTNVGFQVGDQRGRAMKEW